MKNKLLLIFMSAFGLGNAQIRYESGYLITDSGDKEEILIKNRDWNSNPVFFEYKSSDTEEVKTARIKDVREFKVHNGAKYIRADVQIDRSSHNLASLSNQKTPVFKQETVYLKELVGGNVSLYKYTDGNLIKYFYKTDNNRVSQLIYKPYMVDNAKVAYNEDFKKQLEESLKCTTAEQSKIAYIKYADKDLVNLFVAQNKCINPNYEYSAQSKPNNINLNIRPRVNFSSLDLTMNSGPIYTDLGSNTNVGIGVEFEYILPFNKNKWAFIVEPNYHSFSEEVSQDLNFSYPADLKTTVDYKAIEVPFGIRYYMFLNPNSKIFINAQYVIDLPLNATIESYQQEYSVLNNTLELKPGSGLAFGLGYNFLNKYAAEFRFFTERSITDDYILYNSNYKTMSLILSYNLF